MPKCPAPKKRDNTNTQLIVKIPSDIIVDIKKFLFLSKQSLILIDPPIRIKIPIIISPHELVDSIPKKRLSKNSIKIYIFMIRSAHQLISNKKIMMLMQRNHPLLSCQFLLLSEV